MPGGGPVAHRRPNLLTESELPVMANPYQQLKQEIGSAVREPVARASRARMTHGPLPGGLLSPSLRRPRCSPVVLALTPTRVVVVVAGDASALAADPSFWHLDLAQVRVVGRRRLRAVDERGRVLWFHLGPEEPSARGFLAQPGTFGAH